MNIRLLHDLFHPRDGETFEPLESAFAIEYTESLKQRAGIFTTAFRDAAAWKVALDAVKIGSSHRSSNGMPTRVNVPKTTVAMPVGRGNVTTGFVELAADHREVLTTIMDDAVRRYIVKGSRNRINVSPNAPRDQYGQRKEALPSDVIQWNSPEGQGIYHMCKLLNPDFQFEFVTVIKFVDASQMSTPP